MGVAPIEQLNCKENKILGGTRGENIENHIITINEASKIGVQIDVEIKHGEQDTKEPFK